MESKRQKQVSKQVQKELSEIFQLDPKSLFRGKFITVTTVKITPDLSIAKVYLSFLNVKNKEEFIEEIKDLGKSIRHELGNRMRKQLRIIPSLQFFIDDTQEYVEKIDNLFSKIEIPSTEKEYNLTSEQKAED